jgi:quercetin dioxygenase-like cupin family protein
LSERRRVCPDLDLAIEGLRREGYRLDSIFPAEDPHTARLTRGGDVVRLTTRPDEPEPTADLPAFRAEFVLTPAGGSSGPGRAGMHYRDLIPSRLGGRYVASHITIAEGGPVADWVHYHHVRLQLIAVRAGWVRVVYEDQGEPFVMHPGDLVLQPPGIRHRVLESSPGLEVVELSCPALHETLADHDLELPTGRIDPERRFGGQRFVRHVVTEGPDTGIATATDQLAEARFLGGDGPATVTMPPHDGELVFGFVLQGSATLDHSGTNRLGAADAFVIPPAEGWNLTDMSEDFRLLHVTTAKIPSRP